ncbi:MAG TPA: hypothetical protein VGZ47_04835, partial [Gemmataceae bacterium]|nr:hypothetical protein [Gemmataceae bacterium]
MWRIWSRSLPGLFLLVAILVAGCAKRQPPPCTEAEGTVWLDDQPLPFVQVEFIPDLPKFKGELNSMATTDENGHYRLTCGYKDQPGAVIARHRVVIREAPAPREMRGMDGDSQERYARYVTGLKNRPVSQVYGTASTTPLIVEVTA